MMSSPERVPKAMAEKFDAIATLTDSFSQQYLNDEYRMLIRLALAALARKRPSPLLRGRENAWAAGLTYVIGRVNFLDDPSQIPHCRSRTIHEFFGVAGSTVLNKAKDIRTALRIEVLSPDWTLPSRLADNPVVWLIQVDGLIVDVRKESIELQRAAFAQGLIPYVPADH
jgi:hypothetical protein